MRVSAVNIGRQQDVCVTLEGVREVTGLSSTKFLSNWDSFNTVSRSSILPRRSSDLSSAKPRAASKGRAGNPDA